MGTIISSAPAKILSIFNPDDFEAVTGTTVETITGILLIPAKSVAINYSCAELTARILKTGILGTTTLRVYTNTNNVLSGAVLLGTYVGSSNDIFVQLSRTLFIGKSPELTKVFSPSATAFPSDDTRFTAAEVNQAVNWDDDQYIILTVSNANAADSTIGSGILFKIYK